MVANDSLFRTSSEEEPSDRKQRTTLSRSRSCSSDPRNPNSPSPDVICSRCTSGSHVPISTTLWHCGCYTRDAVSHIFPDWAFATKTGRAELEKSRRQNSNLNFCCCSHVRCSAAAIISTCIGTHTNPAHMCVNELISLGLPPLWFPFSAF